MKERSKIQDFTKNLLNRINAIDGRVVGKDMQPFKLRLGKDNKAAMVNDVVDKYLEKRLDDSFLEQAKENYGITSVDILNEIAKREIEKALGS